MPPSSNQGKIPLRQELYQAVSSFSLRQKTYLFILATVFVSSLIGIVWTINNNFLVNAAVSGGSLTEGIVGFPNHINPLLAITDSDRDLTALVYSGLTKINSAGEIIPDLAESYSISPDGLIYTFILKKDLTWHDGANITADDVVFTIQKIQDPNLKSPKRASWDGVNVNKVSDREIHFILKKPYPAFIENTTLGIIPKHIWKNIKTEAFSLSDQNLKGIGSGPYKITSLTRDAAGIPQSYNLSAFRNYALGTPKISSLIFRMYDNEEQLTKAADRGEIESWSSIPPAEALALKTKGRTIEEIPLPRSFAVFFNQNQTIFSNKVVRQALALAVDKQKIVDEVLKGFGTTLDNPIPPGSIGFLANTTPSQPNPKMAISLLEKNGWKKDADGIYTKLDSKKKPVKLEFILSTSNSPELVATAKNLADQWSKIGVKASIQIYDLSDLDQSLIRPRKFEALLFGEVLGRNPDLYAFWHSSQRLAPGLNISQYANTEADKLLEDARKQADPNIRIIKYEKFQLELAKDTQAIFLYSPSFLYTLPNKVKGTGFPSLLVPSDRFSTIQNWYINQEKVWKIFASKK